MKHTCFLIAKYFNILTNISSQISTQTFLSTYHSVNLSGRQTFQVVKSLRDDLGRLFVEPNLQRILTERGVFQFTELGFRKEKKCGSTEVEKRLVLFCKDVKSSIRFIVSSREHYWRL
ncbi:unnamed protein product [Lepeophtheirus salmonis]|uniref:(salmon louse) hypothetical protein n=1 Tax=Lepeophtheirus salmonis TaxID=72036 RepID=A0A7R8HD53_LEPSM|nr:unnamed protein product [Lepeophtheirus salmonis]CAF3003660.1 unnamed protein product [Lepeophtheirus salmonis]